MGLFAKTSIVLILLGTAPVYAVSNFRHIILIVQENRTPDNLFYGLCAKVQCSTRNPAQYDIQTTNWLDKRSNGGTVIPRKESLGTTYDPQHHHSDFNAMCDAPKGESTCRMDGAAAEICMGLLCPLYFPFTYVDPDDVSQYLALAPSYGWANYMFQTNQGPSFPAHQFLFGATSAPSFRADQTGRFVSENLPKAPKGMQQNGCIAPLWQRIQLINKYGVEDPANVIYPCMEHKTVSDLLESKSLGWRYYTPGEDSLWSAPDAIRHICGFPNDGTCQNRDFTRHVDIKPSDVLVDIANCNLRAVSWVIPDGRNSDHAGSRNDTGGPEWVASIVNALGASACKDGNGLTYWRDTAIVITWDDWGGWYDHEPPTFLPFPEGGYQYGFRVPMLFVSAYTQAGYISNNRLDFGSIVRFVENNFGAAEGTLRMADKRATDDLSEFYNFGNSPRTFVPIATRRDANAYIHERYSPTPPDDD